MVTSQLGKLSEQYVDTAQQASSGQRINAPSDDPVSAAENARIRASLSSTNSFRSNITAVRSDAAMAESSLDSAGQVLQRAMELAMTGANGSTGPDEQKALATEADQLVVQMVEIGNAKGAQGYLFGGTQLDTAAFNTDGTFAGNDADHLVQIGPGQPVAVNVSGARAFTSAGGRDVIQDLKSLANALTNGDIDTVKASLESLQSSHEQVVRERSRAGLVLNRLDLSDTLLEQGQTDLQTRASTITAADTNAVYSKLTQLQSSIQQAVTVGKQLLDTSTVQRF
jgi:flagellar hook-associated protein 3 FlgL